MATSGTLSSTTSVSADSPDSSTANSHSSGTHHVSLSAPNVGHFFKLTGDNFLTWKRQMEPFLHGHGFMKYVDGSYPAPPTTILSPTTNTAVTNLSFIQWFQIDQMIISYITSTMTQTLLTSLTYISTSASVWTSLNRLFAAQSVANAANMRFSLYSLSRGTDTITEYMQKAKTLSDSLVAISQPVTTHELMINILRGLSMEYHTFVTTILNSAALLDFEDLRARLLTMRHNSLTPPVLHLLLLLSCLTSLLKLLLRLINNQINNPIIGMGRNVGTATNALQKDPTNKLPVLVFWDLCLLYVSCAIFLATLLSTVANIPTFLFQHHFGLPLLAYNMLHIIISHSFNHPLNKDLKWILTGILILELPIV